MALMRDRPYGSSNFLIDLGDGDSWSVAAGFAEVIFPPFRVDESGRDRLQNDGSRSLDAAGTNKLVLKRGVIGNLDLYAWWDEERRGAAPRRRTVKIELLSDDSSTVVLTWRFLNAKPATLSYSPLRAEESGVVMETLELAFDSMEML